MVPLDKYQPWSLWTLLPYLFLDSPRSSSLNDFPRVPCMVRQKWGSYDVFFNADETAFLPCVLFSPREAKGNPLGVRLFCVLENYRMFSAVKFWVDVLHSDSN
jgi:hypothetical protein